YSLGVLLYELLTGSTPLDGKRLQDTPLLEVLRRIREEEPPRPSTRLSSTAELPAVASARSVTATKLRGLVAGGLDWIVMKCLEKDRKGRYDSASALGRDMQRYLADEPVAAGPPSTWYRLGKFVRRHQRSVLAGTGMVLLLLGGIVGTSIALVRALAAE